MKLLGIEFAPILFTPMHRRIETIATFYYIFEFLFMGILSTILMLILLFTPLFFVPLTYVCWMYKDGNTPHDGNVTRTNQWMRSLTLWKYVRAYFPIKLIKDDHCDLDPKNNYIFINHPHGIMCFGAFINFATEANDFAAKFPNIKSTIITLEEQFKLPIHRDLILSLGARGSSKESITSLLTKNGKGNAVVIIVGGAREALDAVPHRMDFTLHNRKGIIKLAIKHGAHLVPTISFGENDVYEQKYRPENDPIKNLQKKIMKRVGFSPPIFHGRGIINYTFGYLPFRKPITTVVGPPIAVTKNDNPSNEGISEVQNKYFDALTALYNKYKDQCGYSNVDLEIK